MKGKTVYLCDRRKCQNCQYPTCKHTESIFNAKNFHMAGGAFWENDREDIDEAKRNAYLNALYIINNKKEEHETDDENIINVLNELEDEIKELLRK